MVEEIFCSSILYTVLEHTGHVFFAVLITGAFPFPMLAMSPLSAAVRPVPFPPALANPGVGVGVGVGVVVVVGVVVGVGVGSGWVSGSGSG